MTLQSRDPGPSGSRAARSSSGSRRGPGAPCPQPAATMLSRLLKEHQAKQNERKELQGEPNIQSAVFSPAAA